MEKQDKLSSEYPPKQRIITDQQIDEIADELVYDDIRTDVSLLELAKVCFPIGFNTFGGPMTQVEYLKQVYVDELKWVNEEVFQEILQICCGIPGSVVTQMAIAIGSLVTNSWKGGVISFIGFSFPGAFMMGLFGCLYRILELSSTNVPCLGKLALRGFASASVSVVLQAAWKFSVQMNVSYNNIFLIGTSLILYILYSSPLFMVALMIIGGFIMQMSQKEDYRSSLSMMDESQVVSEPRFSKVLQEQRGIFGKNSLYVYVFILMGLVFLKVSSKNVIIEAAVSFYYVGSLLMGGGHVGVPLLLAEFSNLQMISSDVFFNGFSVNNMMPGPVMNLSVYIGGFSDGFRGCLVAYVFLFLPTFLFIWGVLPYWHTHRKDPNITNFIKGAGLVSIGFVFATAYKLWQNAGQEDIVTSSLLVIISFVLLNIYELPAPFVVLLGGVLMVVRYMTLHNYRGVEEDNTC